MAIRATARHSRASQPGCATLPAMQLHAPHGAGSHAAPRNKIGSAAEAVRLIHDGDTVATSGFVGIGFAEGIAVALEQRFLASAAETGIGSPRPPPPPSA